MTTEQVTLMLIEGCDPDTGAAVLTHCAPMLRWADIKLLTIRRPSRPHAGRYIQIPRMTEASYNTFMLRCLIHYVDTPFVLSMHSDGYILNPGLWRDDFLNYDYIGAPWREHWYPPARVGNGGFSLRSRRLLAATAAIPDDHGGGPEDWFICRDHRARLEAMGLRFAPVPVAAAFSLEHRVSDCPTDESKCFGFHGWLAGRNKKDYLARVYASAAPGLSATSATPGVSATPGLSATSATLA